jgi:mono/diheme cytochrome c family protein
MKRVAKQLAACMAMVLGAVIWLDAAHSASLTVANNDAPQKSRMTATTIYNRDCSLCHGQNGSRTLKGKLLGAPNLNDSHWQEKTSDAHIFNVIANGHEKMPAFGKKLSQAQIESLVAYIRRLK